MNSFATVCASKISPLYHAKSIPVLNTGTLLLTSQERAMAKSFAGTSQHAQTVVNFLSPHEDSPRFDKELVNILRIARNSASFKTRMQLLTTMH